MATPHTFLRRFSPILGTTISLAVFLIALAFTDSGRISIERAALDRMGTAEGEPAINRVASKQESQGARTSAIVLRAIDGDTIELTDGERVRYIGIDTPESVDPRRPVECLGQEAARRNRELTLGRTVYLESDIENRDRYGRLLRYVYLADGTMVNEMLAREGFAEPATVPPNVRYVKLFRDAGAEARNAQIGLWGTICEETRDTAVATSTCTIKGNISLDGERIFHTSDCPYYDRTRIDNTHGEQYFCSESDAVAAGFRKAQNCPS